ncbi:Maf family protein [Oceanobacillus picturae]|uniref:Maf family protein n=1 Tax=Oceanobacillus picturae TaxID=171693 RepID=UPI000E6985D7|nr:Maf family protein [Oceanobacillus picturae]RIU90132.1 septum formation protein Maf [Oceanobacillus picturae]
MSTAKLILGSSSPRRQELLKQVHLPFSVRTPDIDESQIRTNNPVEKVEQLAIRKSQAIPLLDEKEVILTADTVVSYKQQIFEKPKNKETAIQMISDLSGETHEVYTGVKIRSLEQELVFVERSEVEFWPLSEEEIDWYVSTTDPYDKAGAYGIQSLGAAFVKRINGDYATIVGLPISKVVRELRPFSIFPY